MSREKCTACFGTGYGTGTAPCWSCGGQGVREPARASAGAQGGTIALDDGPRIIDGLPGSEQRGPPFFQLVYSGAFWTALSGAIAVTALAIHGKFATTGFFIAVFNCVLAGLVLGAIFGLLEPLLRLTEMEGVFDVLKRFGFTVLLVAVGVAVALLSALQHEMFLWTLDWDPRPHV